MIIIKEGEVGVGGGGEKKRERDESDEFELASPEVKRLRDDLLGFLEDSDPSNATPDLDLFMKSFQQEINNNNNSEEDLKEKKAGGDTVVESRPDLGYLLEASDDELGLPPPQQQQQATNYVKETVPETTTAAAGIETWGFDEEIVSYDEFGMDGEEIRSSYNREYVEGLFDYSNAGFSNSTEFIWNGKLHQSETLQISSIPLAPAAPPANFP